MGGLPELISGKKDERKIIRLIKVLRQTQNISIKSFLIELIVIRAFEDNSISGDLPSKLRQTLEYIANNIKSISLIDPANQANIVSATLEDYEKQSLSTQIRNILDYLTSNPNSLEQYFPISPLANKKLNITYGSNTGYATQLDVKSYG